MAMGRGNRNGSKSRLRVVNGNAGADARRSTGADDGASSANRLGKGEGKQVPESSKTRQPAPKTGKAKANVVRKGSRDALRVVPGAMKDAATTREGEGGRQAAREASTADEYEYVSFSEWIRPFLEWLAYWGDELRLPIIIVALILILIATTLIGRMTNTFLIVLAVIIVTLLLSVLIYMAWNSMREARDLYRRAERVYREKSRIEQRSGAEGSITDEGAAVPGKPKKRASSGKARR